MSMAIHAAPPINRWTDATLPVVQVICTNMEPVPFWFNHLIVKWFGVFPLKINWFGTGIAGFQLEPKNSRFSPGTEGGVSSSAGCCAFCNVQWFH